MDVGMHIDDDAVFERAGLRATRQRRAVFAVLRGCRSHPTAEELHRMVGSASCRMSLATVYNTLQAFCDAGICRKVATTDGSCRYDGGQEDHAHLRVPETGEILDLPEPLSRELLDALPPELLQRIGRTMGVRIDGVSLILDGHSRPPYHPRS